VTGPGSDAGHVTEALDDRIRRPPAGCIAIAGLGQAGFAIRGAESTILLDPFLSARPDRLRPPIMDPREIRSIDLVLATHEHGDHLDLPTWTAIAAACPAAQFVLPIALVDLAIAAGIAADRIHGLRIGSPLDASGVRVVAVPARHAVRMQDGYSEGVPGDPLGPRFVGYVVEVDGARVYHAGDTLRYDDQVETVRALAPDVVLLPVNGRDEARERAGIVGNMTPDEAADLAVALDPGLAIPMHHDLIAGNHGGASEFVAAMGARRHRAAVAIPGLSEGILWPRPSGQRPSPGPTPG
jgi:L-ascorbate 6-phosphate lactonase